MNRWHLMLCALIIWVAFSVVPSQATPPVPPMKIVSISVDSVSLTRPLTLTIRVFAGYELKDVSAGILAGEGYRIESQAAMKVGLLKGGDTASFSGAIQPLAKGTWKVQVSARGSWAYDTATIDLQDKFYIHLSDTLNRAFTADEWIRLCGPRDRLQKRFQRDSSASKPSAKPPIDGSHKPEMPPRKHQPNDDSIKTKRSGTFNLIGYLEFHDPRDASGVYRPAKYVIVDVWDNDADESPVSDDDWLGSTMTDGWGYYALYGLDNSDCSGCGTADPYVEASLANSSWRVVSPGAGTVYSWVSSTVSNVGDNETVDFGTLVVPEGSNHEGAMWCYEYMNAGWQVVAAVAPYPDLVECTWPAPATNSVGENHLNIAQGDADAIDAISHEYAHNLMDQGYNGSWPLDCNPDPHYMDSLSCQTFAWTEGWADFFPLVVVQDGKFDWHPNGPTHQLENYPSSSFRQGPTVEGRVATALLDLWDTNNDGLDQNSSNPVSFETIYKRGIQSPRDSTFCEFWNYLRNNELNADQIALGLKSIENNTISCPCFACGDANSDGTIDIADAVFLILFIFWGGAAPGPCNYPFGMGDANGSASVDVGDAVYLISYIFAGGGTPHCA